MRAGAFCVLSAALAFCACLEPDRAVLATRDVDPPRFVETNPPANGVFDKAGHVEITFSERMDIRSLRPGIWLQEQDTRVAIVVEVPPDELGIPEASQQTDIPYTVRIRGEQPLEANTSYTLVLNEVLTDTAGNQLAVTDGGTNELVTLRTGP